MTTTKVAYKTECLEETLQLLSLLEKHKHAVAAALDTAIAFNEGEEREGLEQLQAMIRFDHADEKQQQRPDQKSSIEQMKAQKAKGVPRPAIDKSKPLASDRGRQK